MEIKAKVKIVGGKWSVNGIPLEQYTAGEKGIMQSLVINLIQIGKHVNPNVFQEQPEPKVWGELEELEGIKPTITRLNLKGLNYKFPDWVLNKTEKPNYHPYEDVYPDISKLIFVKAVDKINGEFQGRKTSLTKILTK